MHEQHDLEEHRLQPAAAFQADLPFRIFLRIELDHLDHHQQQLLYLAIRQGDIKSARKVMPVFYGRVIDILLQSGKTHLENGTSGETGREPEQAQIRAGLQSDTCSGGHSKNF